MTNMRIRDRQLGFLAQQSEADYVERLTRFLQNEFPDASTEPVLTLLVEVASQVRKARSYEITSEQDIAIYVITAWLLGVDFDTGFPAAENVLTAAVPGEMKAKFLEDWTHQLFESLESES
jgi:hypothetical protein